MKNIYNLLILLLIGLGSFAQPYYIYTAKKSGMWNDMSVWTIAPRTDGVAKNKVIIPAAYTITADNGVNSIGLGDVQVIVSGRIQMAPNTTINLTNNSSIQLMGIGNVNGTSANQKILIGAVVKYNGSLDGLKTGPSIADNISGTSPNGFRMMSLPVTFANFYVNRTNNEVNIIWATASENNNNHFEVERSLDGRDWSMIAKVIAIGNSNSLTNYSFQDKNMKASIAYYRIRQVDNDGHSTYTAMRSIKNTDLVSITEIFAGSNKSITIRFDKVKTNASVRIWSVDGQPVIQQNFQHSAYISFRLNNALPGIYIVQVIDENNHTESKKIVLN